MNKGRFISHLSSDTESYNVSDAPLYLAVTRAHTSARAPMHVLHESYLDRVGSGSRGRSILNPDAG